MTEKKGRIAHVLAEARASLLEPSRPLTPDKLNKRVTSMANMPSYDAMMEWNTDADRRLISEIDAEMRANKLRSYHLDEEEVSSPASPATSSPENWYAAPTTRDSPGSPMTSPPGAKESPILDMLDQCTTVLNKRPSLSAMKDAIEGIGAVVDRLVKEVDAGRLCDTNTYSRSRAFTLRLLSVADDSNLDLTTLKCLACRHALRVQQTFLGSILASDFQEEIIANVHHATCLLYAINQDVVELREEEGRDSDDVASATAINEQERETDAHLHEAVDCLLAFLDMLWVRLPSELERELLLLRKAGPSSGRPRNMLDQLLTTASYAASILRSYASREVNRRRLLLLDVVRTATDGLLTIGRHAGAFKEQKKEQTRVAKPAIMNIFRVDASAAAPEEMSADIASQEQTRARIMELLCTLSVQTVTLLRNFSLDTAGRKELIRCRSICALCELMSPFQATPELVLSCARVAAKLSLSEAFRSQINSKALYARRIAEVLEREGALAGAALDELSSSSPSPSSSSSSSSSVTTSSSSSSSWPQWYSLSLLSRITFVLGNLTTSNAESRARIMTQSGKGIPALVHLIRYCHTTLETFSKEDFLSMDTGVQDREVEFCDVSVKLLRLLANVSIASDIGAALATREDVLVMLRGLLRVAIVAEGSPTDVSTATDTAPMPARQKRRLHVYEELLLNALAAVTNISFHLFAGTVQEHSPMDGILMGILNCVGTCLFYDHGEVLMEATRAMGNLTRCRSVAAYTAQRGYADALVVLLSHNNFDIQTASAGALVNISTIPAGEASRSCSFLSDKDATIATFVRVLRRASFNYFTLSILVCRIIANLLLVPTAKASSSNMASVVAASGVSRMMMMPSLGPLRETLQELCESTRELMEEAAEAQQTQEVRSEMHSFQVFLDVSNPILTELDGM